jgi:hypothetical protein
LIAGFQNKSQGRCDGPNNKVRISKASQVDKVDFSAKMFGNCVSYGHGDRRLADASGAEQGHKAFRSKVFTDLTQYTVAPNHPSWSRKQHTPLATSSILSSVAVDSGNNADEGVSPSLNVGDVPVSEFAIAERFADRGHVHPETSLLYVHVGPDAINEVLLCDDLTGTRGEMDQDVKRPAAKGERLTVAPEHPFTDRKFERAELQLFMDRGAGHLSAKMTSFTV